MWLIDAVPSPIYSVCLKDHSVCSNLQGWVDWLRRLANDLLSLLWIIHVFVCGWWKIHKFSIVDYWQIPVTCTWPDALWWTCRNIVGAEPTYRHIRFQGVKFKEYALYMYVSNICCQTTTSPPHTTVLANVFAIMAFCSCFDNLILAVAPKLYVFRKWSCT